MAKQVEKTHFCAKAAPMPETMSERPGARKEALHPKTFHVRIRPPFGAQVLPGLSLYVHGETWQGVLSWVESTFPGVDTRPTVFRKNAASSSRPRIGNNDPVVIQDVDAFGITMRIGGRFVQSPAPEGHWRHSVETVAQGLFEVATVLREQSVSLTRSFQSQRHLYERGAPTDSAYNRLGAIKASIERADVWHDNVWRQYCATRLLRDLDMPERHPATENLASAI